VKIQIERGERRTRERERATFIARLWPLALMPFYLRSSPPPPRFGILFPAPNSPARWASPFLLFAAINLAGRTWLAAALSCCFREPLEKGGQNSGRFVIGAGVSSRSYTCVVPPLISSLPFLCGSFLDLCLGCDYLRLGSQRS
jgi:hypothetical protein